MSSLFSSQSVILNLLLLKLRTLAIRDYRVCEQVSVLLNVWLLIARYTETAASLKDVIILLDLSGSLKEPAIEMAKETVRKIIETLGDDDYLNVIKVSNYS